MTPEEELELLMLMAEARERSENEQKPMGIFERVATGVADIVYGGGQFLENTTEALAPGLADMVQGWDESLYRATNGVLGSPEGVTMDDKVAVREEDYRRRSGLQEGEFDGARLTGQVISGLASAPARLASLPALMAEGALYNAAMPKQTDDYWGDTAKDGAIGAVGGVGAKMLGDAGRYIAGRYADPDLAELKRMGVQPTVGQTIGGHVGKFEEAAASVPFAGALFSAPRNRALEEWQLGILNDIVKPLGGEIKEAGEIGIANAQAMIGRTYNAAFELMPSMDVTPMFSRGLNNVFGDVIDMGMSEGAEKAFRKMFRETVQSRVPTVKEFMGPTNGARNVGEITAENLKKMESELTAKINAKGTDPQLREGLKMVRGYIRDQVGAQDPAFRSAIEAADTAYAKYKRVVDAQNAGAANAVEGYTPNQLQRAARSSTSNNNAAAGRGLMQAESKAAQKYLSNTVNDSGTTARAAATAILGTGAGAAINPAAAAATPALWLGGTRGGQKFSNALMEYLMAPAMSHVPGNTAGLFANEGLE